VTTEIPKVDTVNDVLERKISELENLEINRTKENEKPANLLQGEIPIKKPDLPPFQKFEPLKTEVVSSDNNQKPIFVKTEEIKIAQPPQLIKKPQPVFENKPIEIKKDDGGKKDYDDLFGNGIV